MSNLVRATTPNLDIIGDSTAVVLKLSLAEYPFLEKPPGKIVDIQFANHPFDGDSISFDSKTCTVTFEQAFSPPTVPLLSFRVTYDPAQ